MKNRHLLYLLLGMAFPLLLGAFTRDWDEATPTDTTVANLIDEYNRYLRVDTSDRLEDMFYGFTAGENTLSQHAKYIQFYEQASVSQPSAGYGRLYTKAVGGKCELHWQDEDADEIQLTTGGDWGGCNINLLAGMDLLGSSTSDITINTNKFTVAGATGNTVIAGTLTQQGIATLADSSQLASSAAPTSDADIANKKYIDDVIASDVTMSAYTIQDSESQTMLKSHAYLAATAGEVSAHVTTMDNGEVIQVFVGTTNDPAGAGDLIDKGDAVDTDQSLGVHALVAEGAYFEVTCDDTPTIRWISFGTLSKPVDQD